MIRDHASNYDDTGGYREARGEAAAFLMVQVSGVALQMAWSLHLPPTHRPAPLTHSLHCRRRRWICCAGGTTLAALNEVRGKQCALSGFMWVCALRVAVCAPLAVRLDTL